MLDEIQRALDKVLQPAIKDLTSILPPSGDPVAQLVGLETQLIQERDEARRRYDERQRELAEAEQQRDKAAEHIRELTARCSQAHHDLLTHEEELAKIRQELERAREQRWTISKASLTRFASA